MNCKALTGTLLLAAVFLAAAIRTTRIGLRSADNSGVTTIQVAHFVLDPSFRRAFDLIARNYEASHPGVEIKRVDVPRSIYAQWQRTRLVGGDSPEIMQFAYFMTGVEDMVAQHFRILDGQVEAPNPYNVESAEAAVPWRDTFVDGMTSRDAFSQKLRVHFGIPLVVGGYRLFVNEDLWRQYSTDKHATVTFDSLIDRFNNSNRAPEGPHLVGGSSFSAYVLFHNLYAAVTQPLLFRLDRNGDLDVTARECALGYLDGSWNHRTPEVFAAYSLMREFSRIMPTGFLQLGKEDGVFQFVQGHSILLAGGLMDVSYLREIAPFKLGEEALPAPARDHPEFGEFVLGPVNEIGTETTLTLGVVEGPRAAIATDFLKFLTSRQSQELLARKTGWVTAVVGSSPTGHKAARTGFPDGLYGSMNLRHNSMAFSRNLHLLFGPNGGAEVLAGALDSESKPTIRASLLREASSMRQLMRRQDIAAIARWWLASGSEDPDPSTDSVDDFFRAQHQLELDYDDLSQHLEERRRLARKNKAEPSFRSGTPE
ncbi:MAG: hypothetical protein R3F07_16475 [Opitutaceae bacterium]